MTPLHLLRAALLVPLFLVADVVAVQDPPLSRREFEARIGELDRRVMQRFELNDRAIDAALASMNDRLTGMNEFRATLRDQAGNFVARSEYASRLAGLEDKVRTLELSSSSSQGASTRTVVIMGAFFTVLQIGLAVWKRKSGGGA